MKAMISTTNDLKEWWRTAAIYQVYLRSFADSDGDGNGDLAGLLAHMDHIAGLGVDAIWLNPWFRSPMVDNGYDVSDYRDIDPMFGDLTLARAVIHRAHELGLRVIVDMVANHTSDQHPWFQQALRAAPGSAERSRFHFADGRGPDGEQPPNDWISAFGGRAWTRTFDGQGRPGQWYLHIFAPQQPDLNWANPQVGAEFEDVFRFWFDRDVDGMRIDAASAFAKAAGLPDSGLRHDAPFQPVSWADSPFWDVEEVHAIHRHFRTVADSYDPPRMLVGEVVASSPEAFAKYLRPDELHSAFNLAMVSRPWDAGQFREVIDATLAALAPIGAPASWVLSSHDETRHLSRFAPQPGDGEPLDGVDLTAAALEVATRRARASILLTLALPGSAYIYQGEELGLPEAHVPDEFIQDPIFQRSEGRLRGRDGARVPLPWSADAPACGFSATGKSWLPQPAIWGRWAVAGQEIEPGSMLTLYKKALQLRRLHLQGTEDFQWLDSPEGVLAFRRGVVDCVINMSDRSIPLAGGRRSSLLLSSGSAPEGELPPDTAVWIIS